MVTTDPSTFEYEQGVAIFVDGPCAGKQLILDRHFIYVNAKWNFAVMPDINTVPKFYKSCDAYLPVKQLVHNYHCYWIRRCWAYYGYIGTEEI